MKSCTRYTVQEFIDQFGGFQADIARRLNTYRQRISEVHDSTDFIYIFEDGSIELARTKYFGRLTEDDKKCLEKAE